MVSLAFIKSLTSVADVDYLIDLGKRIVADNEKQPKRTYYDNVIRNWGVFFPALEAQRVSLTSRKRRRCHGCEYDLCGQRDHMGGCLPDYDETWTDLE